jgi:hypothetical protein
MTNRFLTSTALAVALSLPVATGAYAQTYGTGTQQSQPKQTQQSQPNASQRLQSGANVLLQETPDTFLARQDLVGADVRNAQNEDIGNVEDIVVDKNGRIKGVVVGVGGFLGIGEKHVALAWDELQMRQPEARSGSPDAPTGMTASRQPTLVANVTRDQLKQAPEFKRYDEVRRDDGAGMRTDPNAPRSGSTRQDGTRPSQ